MKTKTLFAVIALVALSAVSVVRASDLSEEALVSDFAPARSHIGYRKAERLVRMLYRGALFREADPGGLQGWTQQVVNGQFAGLVNTASGFGGSPEFNYNVYAAHSTQDILRNLYYQLLNRDVDPSGWAYWLPMLDQHRGAEVVSGIVGSQEFRTLHHLW
jgi:hypothetical protein